MRTDRLIAKVSKSVSSYLKAYKRSPYNGQDAIRQLTVTFGPSANQLPPSLRIELLNPHLQQYPHRKELFVKLSTSGQNLLSLLINDHLGTRNVEVPSSVLARYCQFHRITNELGSSDQAVNYVYQCIGAVHLFVDPKTCRSMVKQNLLDGSTGITNLYLEALSNNELTH